MANCDVLIDLDARDAEVHPGDAITGAVTVIAREAVKTDGLAVLCEWYTEGSGEAERGEAGREVLFRGEWPPGTHRHRFSLAAPLGPLTYEGKGLKVRWRVRAVADLPWAVDPSTDVGLRLTPRPGTAIGEPYFFGPAYKVAEANKHDPSVSPTATGAPAAKTSTFVAVVTTILMLVLLMMLPWLLVMASPLIVFVVVRSLLVRGKLGAPTFEVTPLVTCPGGQVMVRVTMQAKADVELTGVSVELRAEESLRRGKSRQTHRLVSQTLPMAPARRLRRDERFAAELAVAIPADAPYTFAGNFSEVQWGVHVLAEVRRWPDWFADAKLTIRPGTPPTSG